MTFGIFRKVHAGAATLPLWGCRPRAIVAITILGSILTVEVGQAQVNIREEKWAKLYPSCLSSHANQQFRNYAYPAMEAYCDCAIKGMLNLVDGKTPPFSIEVHNDLGAATAQCKYKHLDKLGPKEKLKGNALPEFISVFARSCFAGQRKNPQNAAATDSDITAFCDCSAQRSANNLLVEEIRPDFSGKAAAKVQEAHSACVKSPLWDAERKSESAAPAGNSENSTPASVKAEVEKAHPGWEALVRSSKFTEWRKAQPSWVSGLAYSDDPKDAIRMLDFFKREVTTPKGGKK